ncbi:MAG TPA: SgcJ/EcaC family oxidoreductase [Terriglobales bacterium]|nr:SgcJ/EcaC family oxidoreductase [Terriglobales bacterium]
MPIASDEVESLISKIGEEWARHWNAGELEKLIAAYATEAVYMPPHHAAVHGRDAIHEYLKGPLRHGVRDLRYEVTFIKHSGDLAYDVGRYSMSLPEPSGVMRQDRGKYLTVWRRQADGNWKIVADCWSSDLPPAH